jgi:ATP-dependent protease ClpP protease subunit
MKYFLLIYSLIASSIAFGRVSIEGPILEPSALAAFEIANHSDGETAEIYINSPGGLIPVGALIIKAIESVKERGGTVRCYAQEAQSIAFQIFLHCSERYAYEGGVLMFHYPQLYIKGMVTWPELEEMVVEVRKLAKFFFGEWKAYIPLPDSQLHRYASESKTFKVEEFVKIVPGFCKILPPEPSAP